MTLHYCSLCGSIAEGKEDIGLVCPDSVCKGVGGGFLEVSVGDIVELLKGGSITIQQIQNPKWQKYIDDKDILRVVGWGFERIGKMKKKLIMGVHESDENSRLDEQVIRSLIDNIFAGRP
jgi:hypothetical protein